MPLNRRQLIQLGAALMERRRVLLDEIAHDVERAREVHRTDVGDAGDDAAVELAVHLDIADLTRDVDELAAIEAARRRLAEHRYGACIDCGEEIGFERLRAEPAALRCIVCQRMYEKAFSG